MNSTRTRLDHFANIAIIVVCGLMVVHLVRGLVQSSSVPARDSASPDRPPVAQPKEGDVLPESAKAAFSGADRTLILVTVSTCKYCTESMPFYERLSAAAREQEVRLVAATMEDPDINEAYLSRHGVRPSSVVSVADSRLPVRGTPTLLFVDSGGKILRLWRGRLPADREQDVLKSIGE